MSDFISVNIEAITTAIIESSDFGKAVSQAVNDDIDIDDIASEIVRNLDMSDLASDVADYIDIDDKISMQVDDCLSNSDYLDSDSLRSLMNQYSPGNGCSLGDAATNIVDEGFCYLLDDTNSDLYHHLSAFVIKTVKTQLARVDDANVENNAAESGSSPVISFTMEELKYICYYLSGAKDRHFRNYPNIDWLDNFPSILLDAAAQYGEKTADKVRETFK